MFITLTNYMDGKRIYLKPETIEAVYPSSDIKEDYATRVATREREVSGDDYWLVKESPKKVVKLCREHWERYNLTAFK